MDAIGLMECSSIPIGRGITDTMVKDSPVRVVTAGAVCPGRFVAIVAGDAAAVRAAIDGGKALGGQSVLSAGTLASVAEPVIRGLFNPSIPASGSALGVFETSDIASAIVGADAACKAGDVEVNELRLTQGMGGKSLAVLSGSISHITIAMEQVRKTIEASALLSSAILPALHPEIVSRFFDQ